MKILFENEYQTIYFHEEIRAFEERFKKESENIYGNDYIREVTIFGDVIAENQPPQKLHPNVIISTLEGGPTMEPKVQKFMHDRFYPFILKNGITTKAYCLGAEIISKLSVELTAEDNPMDQFTYKFFDNLEDGMSWLKSLEN